MRSVTNRRRWAARLAILAIAAGIGLWSIPEQQEAVKRTGSPQLVAVRELPQYGEACEPTLMEVPEYDGYGLMGSGSVEAGVQREEANLIDRDPLRTIRDVDPIYSAVAVNTETNEVVLGDNNLWALRTFNRLDNTPANAPFTEPKRVIHGVTSQIQFINGMYIDPKNGDIYTVETDTGDKITVFAREANGDVAPKRILKVPHRGFSLSVNEDKQEIYVGVHYPPEIAIFPKNAEGNAEPLRRIQGESTRLAYVHGMVMDTKNNRLFVANWGKVSDYRFPGTGRFEDPSITVYPLDANGDAAPVGIIQGSLTQLNWPAQMGIDPETGELYVANDMGQSVLVFKATDKGNVAPTRVIKGNRTGLQNPHGLAVDKKNNELWITNFGNSSAVVYPLNANGNVAPIRTIRSAPLGKKSLKFGKVEALAYDQKRDQIWVPN